MVVSYLPYSSSEQPATNVVAVTKSNTVDDPAGPFRAFLIDGNAGDIKFETLAGTEITLTSCEPGIIYPICFVRVADTGTAATLIYGLK